MIPKAILQKNRNSDHHLFGRYALDESNKIMYEYGKGYTDFSLIAVRVHNKFEKV